MKNSLKICKTSKEDWFVHYVCWKLEENFKDQLHANNYTLYWYLSARFARIIKSSTEQQLNAEPNRQTRE